ncbi:MAG: DUF2652 domain-containing protein, partial [Chitinophagaceae bacterium]|nr:DUF2652 domain-containing protein [Chitinophagaceae bacterium]
MAETNATILIPDISGFTEFMTSTELSHSSFAINMLIEAIIKAVDNEFEVSEIEGDAVLLIRKGITPSQKQLQDICLKIFDAFHFQRKWMQQHAVCPCRACLALIDLTLKFIVHHGPLAEIKVGRFTKQSGPEMIVAHRLLKNAIKNNEYLLMTEKLLEHAVPLETGGMDWINSFEEYPSIGKVDYRFALLNDARKKCPEPPALEDYYKDDTPYFEKEIPANFRDVYMVMMNIPGRSEWMPGLEKVEQDMLHVYVGSVHYCTFENYQAIVSPLRMIFSGNRIIYAESCHIKEIGINLVHEYIFDEIDERNC